MEGDSDKLSRFIKSRLDAAKDTNADWDQPDASVWEDAKSQMTPPQKDRKKVIPFWFYGLCLAILLLLALFSTWQSAKLKNEVKEQLEEQVELVAQLQEQVTGNLKKQQSQDEQKSATIEKLQQDNERLVEENKQIKKESKQTQKQYQALRNTSDRSNNEKELLATEEGINIEQENGLTTEELIEGKNNSQDLFQKQSPSIDKSARGSSPLGAGDSEAITIDLPHLSTTRFYVQQDLKSFNLKLSPSNPIIIPKKQNRNKFELGLNYGLSILKVASTIELNNDKELLKKTNEVSTAAYHLHLAYSLKKNLWIKSGVRYSNYFYKNNFQFKTEYDNSREYEKPDGTLANELSLQISNGYFRTTQNVALDIPDDSELETGDWIFGEFEETQRIKTWQVPLGIEYRQRKNKLGWQMEAAAVLNIIEYSDAEIESNVQSTQKIFSTEIVNNKYDSSVTTLLFSAQAGLGLHYQINKNLNLRADVIFQYNPYFTSQNIQMGVGYSF